MLSEFDVRELSEFARLQSEAEELLDLCLTDGDDSALIAFVDQQIASHPPHVPLLHDLVDALQLRLLSLREYRFDVRDRIVRLFKDDYGVDVTGVAPPDALNRYHSLDVEAILACLSQRGKKVPSQEYTLLQKTVEASLEIAAQLSADIALVDRVLTYVSDWLDALKANQSRRYIASDSSSDEYVQ
jgi:hypothetical protein